MAALERTIVTTNKFILQELPEALRTDEGVILKDAGRSAVLAQYTLMGKIAATGKWEPYDNTSTNGSATTPGVYIGEDIAAADIVAADISDASILYFGARCDEDKLVLENSVDLDSSTIGATVSLQIVRELLKSKSLFFQTTEQVMGTY